MYELIVLGFLMQMPAHGFLIVKIVNDAIGPVAKVSNARIYPLLGRLATDGLVAVHEEKTSENGLPMRVYRITEQGRLRFREVMLDITSHPREYSEIFTMKAIFLSFLPKEERLYLIDRYIDYCRAHVRHQVSEFAGYQAHGAPLTTPVLAADYFSAIEHLRRRWLGELAWAKTLRARQEADEPTGHAELSIAVNELMAAIGGSAAFSETEKDDLLLAVSELNELLSRPRGSQASALAALASLARAVGSVPETSAQFAAVHRLALVRLQ